MKLKLYKNHTTSQIFSWEFPGNSPHISPEEPPLEPTSTCFTQLHHTSVRIAPNYIEMCLNLSSTKNCYTSVLKALYGLLNDKDILYYLTLTTRKKRRRTPSWTYFFLFYTITPYVCTHYSKLYRNVSQF